MPTCHTSSLANINLAWEVVVVGIFIPRQAPPPRPQTKILRQLQIVLTEPEQAERIFAKPQGEAVPPLPGGCGPGPVLLGKICGKKTRVLIVRVGFVVRQRHHVDDSPDAAKFQFRTRSAISTCCAIVLD